jgi:hypothetical protein
LTHFWQPTRQGYWCLALKNFRTKKGARICVLIGNKYFNYCPVASLTPSRGVAKNDGGIVFVASLDWHFVNKRHLSTFPYSLVLLANFLFVFYCFSV